MMRPFALLLFLVPLAAHAQSVPPEHIHSIMYSPYAATFYAAREAEARRRGIDVSFMHGGGAAGITPPPASCPATGTQYYVSSSQGSDSNDGLSPNHTSGTHGPWASIAKVNSPGLNFTANQCINFYGPDTFAGCLVLKTGTNVSGSSSGSSMYLSTYGTGIPTINSNCPGSQTAAVTIDGVNGFLNPNPINVNANGTMTQYGWLLINSGSSQSGPVTINLGDVSGFWTNINTNGSTAAEVYVSGGYGSGGINGVHLIGGTLHGATVTSNDDAGIIGNNENENILNLTATGADIYNMGSLPGGCNGSTQCPGRGEGILVDGVNGAVVSFNRIHDIGANVNTCGGPSGLETFASNNVLREWNEVYNVRPLNGTYPGTGCDWDGFDQDGGSTNITDQFNYSHNNGGAGFLHWMGTDGGSFGWGPNITRYNISENDNTLGAQVGGGFASFTFSGQSLSVAKSSDYNNTIYQANTGTHGPYSPVGFVGNGTPTSGSVFANNALVTTIPATGANPDIQCLNYAGGNMPLTPVAFKANGYSGGPFSATGCNSGNVSTLAAWQAVATGGDTGATTASPAFTGTPPFGALTWNPATQTGQLPGPTGYEPTAAAYINTGLNLSVSPYSQTLPTQDYAGATLPTGVGTGYPIGALAGVSSPSTPAVASITSSCSGTVSTVGTNCRYDVVFTSTVFVGGTWHPRLALATAPVPSLAYLCDDIDAIRTLPAYARHCGGMGSGNGTNTLHFGAALWGGQIASPVVTSGINLNGATIQDISGTNASLTGAASVSITGLSYAPGNAYCVTASGGNDSSSGLCGTASFATLAKAQTAARGGAVKTIYLQNVGGIYNQSNQASTCTFHSNTDNNGTGTPVTSYVCLTSADNGEVWAAFPGQAPVISGGATSDQNCPSSGACTNVQGVFVAFQSSSASNITRQGFIIQNFQGGGMYDIQGTNLIREDNTYQNLFNNGGSPCAGDCVSGNGAAGCTEDFNWWTNVYDGHSICSSVTGFGLTTNSGESGLGGFTMTKTFDNNMVTAACGNAQDCGAIYTGWYPYGNTLGLGPNLVYVTDNLVNGVGAANASNPCIYLDWQSSGIFGAGNICTGLYTWATEYDLGANNVFTNNVFDITSLAPNWDTSGSKNNTVWFNTFVACGRQGCVQQGSMNINKNIIYNRDASHAPPNFMGLTYASSSSFVSSPTLGLNWYYTVFGTYASNFPWANATLGSGASGVSDPSGVLANPMFVNPSARTAAGFQLAGGAAPLAGGFAQIPQTQGPR